MSAWIVSKKHIDLMVLAVAEGTRDGLYPAIGLSAAQRDRLGQSLVDECVRSVSHRYPNDDVQAGDLPGPCDPYYLRPYRFEDPRYRPTAAELYKAVDCYAYQSSEHPGWEASKVKRLCDQVRKAVEGNCDAARRFAAAANQPSHARHDAWREWEVAPWGFDVEEIALCHARTSDHGRAFLSRVNANPGDAASWGEFSDWLQDEGVMDEPLDAEYGRRLICRW